MQTAARSAASLLHSRRQSTWETRVKFRFKLVYSSLFVGNAPAPILGNAVQAGFQSSWPKRATVYSHRARSKHENHGAQAAAMSLKEGLR